MITRPHPGQASRPARSFFPEGWSAKFDSLFRAIYRPLVREGEHYDADIGRSRSVARAIRRDTVLVTVEIEVEGNQQIYRFVADGMCLDIDRDISTGRMSAESITRMVAWSYDAPTRETQKA